MKIMKTEKFTHDGKEYELKAVLFEKGLVGEVFYQGRKLGVRSLTPDTAGDPDTANDYIAMGHSATSTDLLFESLKEEIVKGNL